MITVGIECRRQYQTAGQVNFTQFKYSMHEVLLKIKTTIALGLVSRDTMLDNLSIMLLSVTKSMLEK